ncbi:MAG: hypothetical protein Q7J22_00100 [Candidatus Wolfebacteria bacterium]|nr:hypothetical protein [Candidatus Wolfebacteria bacterium]
MLSYTDLKPGTIFLKGGEPHKVLEYSFVRMQAQRPMVQLKLRNLLSGKIVPMGAQQSDEFEEAEIESAQVVFIYAKEALRQAQGVRKGESTKEYWFHEKNDKSKRFSLSSDLLQDAAGFLKSGTEVLAEKFEGRVIGVQLPIKMDLKVAEAPPSIRGNTSQGGTKVVVLETGAKVSTPLFINAGDVIRVNTETGEYAERMQKG